VAWLQVAVDDPLPVEVANDLRQLLNQAERLGDGVRSAGEPGGQAAVRDVFRGHVRGVAPPAGPLDENEVRVREPGPEFGVAPKSGLPLFPRAEPRRKDFQG